MTKEQFFDLKNLGQKITEYCRAMENFRAVKENRMQLAKNLRIKYPNMKIEAIRDTLWEQEGDLEKTSQLAFNEMRMCAYSVGWALNHNDVNIELSGILRRNYPNLKDIDV